MATQGGTHEQHVKSGQQSHKNTPATGAGSHDQQSQAKSGSNAGGTQGGSHEQHVNAGKQSHKGS